MDGIVIRPATAGDLAAVAELRWQMHQARRETTVPQADFVADFLAWAAEHESSHRCLVAVSDGSVIGMAWLAVTPRVPFPGTSHRASGDLQSMYVLPEHRGNRVGGRLVEAVLALARDLGLERVTVHSSRRAVPMYERAGFELSPVLFQADTAHPGAGGTAVPSRHQ